LVALAFLTSGSVGQTVTAPDTWSEIALVVLGAGTGATILIMGARGRRWGAATAGLFAVLTAYEGLSIAWSVQPDWSWFGADQMLSYLAVFAAAAAMARLFPARWPALVGAIAVGMAALSAYSLLAKVFPATLNPANTYGRLTAPFGYWNAIGVSAALGLPACLWSATRRDHGRILRSLSAPAMTMMITVVVLSYSRSALLAMVLGAGLWITLMPLRLRALLMLAVAGAGSVPIILSALASHALTGDVIALGSQDAAGHSFGVVLLVVLAGVSAAGLTAALAIDRLRLAPSFRNRVNTVLVVLVALIPVGGVVALATSSRGLTGEISHAWSTLTNPNGVALDTPGRIGQLGSSRPLYWNQGLQVGGHALLNGVGELGYGIARLRYTTRRDKSDQAHSYLVQTFADLGLVGLALTLGLLLAWAAAAARPLAPRTRWRSRPVEHIAESEGLLTVAIVAVMFGLQSAIDWTWYFPGVTIPALLCAGWLAGRGPVTGRVGTAKPRRPLSARPGAAFAITILVALALLGGWVIWQPLRSANQLTAAENATTNPQAFAAARAAIHSDPVAYTPLFVLSGLYQGIKDPRAARAELVRATGVQPQNPVTWFTLGSFDLQTSAWRPALTEMNRVLALDHTPDVMTAAAAGGIMQARAALTTARARAKPVRSR
jgi:hypothetical protein